MHEGFMLKYNSCHFSPFVVKSQFDKNSLRGHTDLNHGPIGLQPIALPLSYIPAGSHRGWPHGQRLRRQDRQQAVCACPPSHLATWPTLLRTLLSHTCGSGS